jgi:hypothetical protein
LVLLVLLVRALHNLLIAFVIHDSILYHNDVEIIFVLPSILSMMFAPATELQHMRSIPNCEV